MKDFHLTRPNALAYLDRLADDDALAVTVCVPPGLTSEQVDSILEPAVGTEVPARLVQAVKESRTGACLFWGTRKALLLPPFPVADNAIFAGLITRPISDILRRDRLIGVVLIRLGAYAVGVFRGDIAVTSKVGTGLVHARHRQGGSSSARFRRHREKQIEQFLLRVCEKINEHLGPYLDSLDHAIYGGARTTIDLLQKECPVLRRLEDRILPPLLDVPDPRQAVLEAAIRRVWSTRVLEWEDE